MSLNISRYLDTSDPESGYMRDMVLAWTMPPRIDRYANDQATFDWPAFVNTGTYTPAGGAAVNHTQVWLVNSFNDNIAGVPAFYTHFGLITRGGNTDLNEAVGLEFGGAVSLYICTRANYGPNRNNWLIWNGTDRITLTASSSDMFKSTTNSKKEVLMALLDRGSSADQYPGSFVFVDRHTLFSLSPSKLIQASFSNMTKEKLVADFYFDSPGIAVVPAIYDDYYTLRTVTLAGGNNVKQLLRFASTELMRGRILAVRPGINSLDVGGQNTYNFRHFHEQLSAVPYFVTPNPAGQFPPAQATALASLLARTYNYVHNLTFVNSSVVKSFDDPSGGFTVSFLGERA
jgi:hypothetical protein